MKHPLALLPVLALAACGDTPPPVKMFCPPVAVLQQAAMLTAFLPGRQDVAAQITTAQVTGVAGACRLEPDKHALLVTFKAGFSATNGPANSAKALTLPYFVAISQGNTVISKSEYNITVNFDGNVTAAAATSPTIRLELPNQRDTARIDILVGFQLSQDQLAYAAAHAR